MESSIKWYLVVDISVMSFLVAVLAYAVIYSHERGQNATAIGVAIFLLMAVVLIIAGYKIGRRIA